MSNKRWSDVRPNRDDKDGTKQVTKPSGKPSPASADFKQIPEGTSPKVVGPGSEPQAP